MSDKEVFKGIFVPVFTPMFPDGEINTKPIANYVETLTTSGVTGIFLNGTSGEFFNLSLEERNSLAKVWLHCCQGKLKVILNIGASNLKDTQELLKLAEKFEMKADAYAVISPSYIPPATLSDLVDYVTAVTEMAPHSKFFYYHIPMYTHCGVKLDDFLEAANLRIPNLIGIKFTDSDEEQLKKSVSIQNGKFVILVGNEILYHTGLALRCDGVIFSSANFCPTLLKRMSNNANSNGINSDSVAVDYFRLNRIIQILNQSASHGMMSCLKNITDLCDLQVGKPRLPQKSLSEKEIENLKTSLIEIGFFDWR